MTHKEKLGWIPDVPSIHDYTEGNPKVVTLLKKTRLKHRVTAHKKAVPLPKQVDLRTTGNMPEIETQGALGSCAANAAVSLIEYFQKKASGSYVDISRLFVYKVTRNLMKVTGDCGSNLRAVLGSLVLFGAPPEEYWPYDTAKFDDEPPAFCYSFASNFKTLKYFTLSDPNDTTKDLLHKVKTYITGKFPCIFGFTVYKQEIIDAKNNGGLVSFPSPTSELAGGHCVVACGYDDNLVINGDKGAILIRNSWGTHDPVTGKPMGDLGYFWLPYRYLIENQTSNWWTVLNQDWVDTGKFS